MLSDTTLYLISGLFMTKAIQLWIPMNRLPARYHSVVHLFLTLSFMTIGIMGILLVSNMSFPIIILKAFAIMLTILATASCVYALATSYLKQP